MQIFMEIPRRAGIKLQWVARKWQFSVIWLSITVEPFEIKTEWLYVVPKGLSTDPEIDDLEGLNEL